MTVGWRSRMNCLGWCQPASASASASASSASAIASSTCNTLGVILASTMMMMVVFIVMLSLWLTLVVTGLVHLCSTIAMLGLLIQL